MKYKKKQKINLCLDYIKYENNQQQKNLKSHVIYLHLNDMELLIWKPLILKGLSVY